MGKQPRTDKEDSKTDRRAYEEVVAFLRGMGSISAKDWKRQECQQWQGFLKWVRNEQERALQAQGYKGSQIKRVLQDGWAFVDPDTGKLVHADRKPAAQAGAVPALIMLRDESYDIHDLVLQYLPSHPIICAELESAKAHSPKAFFELWLRLLESVGRTAPDLSRDANNNGGSVFAEGDQHVFDCDVAFCQLRMLMNQLEAGEVSGQCEGKRQSWWKSAKASQKFWGILNAAIKAGGAFERFQIYQDERVRASVFSALAGLPGKGVSAEGKAVEIILEKYWEERGEVPTTKQVLQWLGVGDLKVTDKDPVVANHKCWSNELAEVSPEKLNDLIKYAKKRMWPQ